MEKSARGATPQYSIRHGAQEPCARWIRCFVGCERPGETVALVGNRGCGKSVSALSIMRLVAAPAGRITGGQILFKGRDLLTLPDHEMRRYQGQGQSPWCSRNP